MLSGEALIGGVPLPDMDKTIRIRVTRQFYYKGVLQPVGKELDYPYYMAIEAIAIGKAERAPEPKAVVAEPAKTTAKKEKE